MADSFFSKIGSALRTTAGVGVGSIEVVLERTSFAPGDVIRGRLVLTMAEEMRARRLVVRLHASRRTVSTSVDARGQRSRTHGRETVYKFDQELDGERAYPAGTSEHWFAISVPSDIGGKIDIPGEGFVSDVARVVTAVAGAVRRPLEWKLIGFLHIPWKRDVKKASDIQVVIPG
jgi:hypothetical protein